MFLRDPDCNFEGNNSVSQSVSWSEAPVAAGRTDGWLVGWIVAWRTYLKTKGNGAVYNWKQVARDSYMTSMVHKGGGHSKSR